MNLRRGVVSLLLIGLCGILIGAESPEIQSQKLVFASAVCSRFTGVSDLPYSGVSADVLQRLFSGLKGCRAPEGAQWRNGNRQSLQDWFGWLADDIGDGKTTLVLYLSSHQMKNGAFRTTIGEEIPAKEMVDRLNILSRSFRQVLLINDSCYAEMTESGGSFDSKIIRLYACRKKELSIDLEFQSAPYGVSELAKPVREWLEQNENLKPKGLSWLTLMGIRSVLILRSESVSNLNWTHWVQELSRQRDLYDRDVRQHHVQTPILLPDGARLEWEFNQ